ncbi:hypothetical protein CVT24_001150 [Panaeolus cyanescens]|uniref:G domain-containing protein n=1 Tax=Panaeolus cyanescens TaxID=181874 RepID=A0A409X688_9AGAR|nr:hypothetical protein CVT24_001150 [Panaeolus cyanescens]
MDASNSSCLTFTGPVSVKRQSDTSTLVTARACVILLLGLTGTGKSSFIEALSGGNADLKISGNTLESVTTDLTVYELVNAHFGSSKIIRPIFLIDCPGFCDDKTSEFKLVTMIQTWMKDLKRRGAIKENHIIETILYFHRITDKRLASTQKETLRLISSLVGDPYFYQTGLAVVTTMWDTLWSPAQVQEAEIRFTQLKENLKGLLGPSATQALRFDNTQNSALQIIDEADFMCRPATTWARAQRTLRSPPLAAFHNQKLRDAPFSAQLLHLIHERIARLEQKIRILDDDILDARCWPGVCR